MRRNSLIHGILAAALSVAPLACGGGRRAERADNGPGAAAAATPAPVAAAEASPAAAESGRATPAGTETATAAAPTSPPAAVQPAPAPAVQPAGAASTSDAPAAASPAADDGGAAASQEASATTILNRAAAAYRAVQTLQADFVQQLRNPLLGESHTSRGTMYQRRPDRFLMRFTEPAGDVIVSDGRYFWVYYPSVDPKQVIRMPSSAAGGGVDLQTQFLGDPAKRFVATLDGREKVAGHDAYVLTLVPRSTAELGYQKLRVWIDPTDYLARRFEITEDNGNVRHFELSRLRANGPVAADLFRFTPPADARVVERG
ncbi:MAG: outer membrane lipoprotein carrier protein LolA [Gemmatimonadetes bacterium]|nr:outer membrane lipoprotein carrier protein LolA [Gemmatimonadota bacterium]